MKKILTLLLATGIGLSAQTQPADSGASARDAILRQAMRAAIKADDATNVTATNSVAKTPVVVVPATPVVVVPVATVPATNVPIVAAPAPGAVAPSVILPAQTVNGPASGVVLPVQTVPTIAVSNTAAIQTNGQTPNIPNSLRARRSPRSGAPNIAANPASVPASANTVNDPANTAPTAVQPAIAAQPVVAPAKPAEETIPPGTIDFREMPIVQVLPVYAELVGRTILRGNTLPPINISLTTQTPLTKTEAIQALDTVLAMNNITMINVGDKFVKAVPVNQAYQQAAPFTSRDGSQLPEADQYITQIVQLKYAKPTEVVPALQPLSQIPNSILAIDSSQILIVRDYSANVKRMLELLKQIDVTVPMDYESEVIPIKYAQASDIASALSSLGSGSGTTIGHGATTGRSGGGGILGGGGGLGGAGTTGGIGGTGTTGFGGGIGNTGGGLGQRTSSFGDRLQQIVSKAAAQGEFQVLGKTKIIADARTNSLLVFANKQDMDIIKKIVSELDIVLAQVLIEAIIMEVSLDTSHSLGVSYIQRNASTPGNYFVGQGAANNGAFLNSGNFASSGTNGPSVPSGLSYLANFGGDFSATLTAIANDSSINVLSKPRIQTSHGVAATLQVGQQVPIVSGTYFGGINGQASSQYQEQFVGISLQVTPLINPDGLVVMDISQNVQQLGPNYTIDGNPVPSTTQRSAQATVSVKDRDTIILGGMIQTSKNVSNAGVPLLKDIPGLGYLFRSTSSDKQRTELIVLIRPTVLPTPEAAALVATHERDKLPGIKAAERESRIDENRRLQESDKIKVPKERD